MKELNLPQLSKIGFSSGVKYTFMLSILLLLLAGSAAFYVKHLYQDLSSALEINAASVRAAEELEISLRDIQSQLMLSNLLRKDGEQENNKLKALKAETDKWLREVEDLSTTPFEHEIVKQIKPGYEHFFAELNGALGSNQENSAVQQQIRSLVSDILMKEIIPSVHEYLDFNEKTMTSTVKQHHVLSNQFAWTVLLIGLMGSMGGFLVGYYASRSMKNSMVELNLPLSIAAGKLSEVVGPIHMTTSLDLKELKKVLQIIASETATVVERLQKSQREVMHAEKLAAIGHLAAGTAHEIRNPLMTIKLLIQSALINKDAPLSHTDLEVIEQRIEHLEKTIQNLLDFSRKPSIERKRISLNYLIRQSISLIAGRASIQNVTIHGEGLQRNIFIEGDYHQLQQVILNLLINALDATKEGNEIKVTLETQAPIDGKAQSCRVLVADNGNGIPKEILSMMFEPFVSDKEVGTGLGLSISKQIVEAHRGEIFAFNQNKKGAVVGFTLPVIPQTASC
jgi:signal transduction histidine kinase